jgi:hypothetical protein
METAGQPVVVIEENNGLGFRRLLEEVNEISNCLMSLTNSLIEPKRDASEANTSRPEKTHTVLLLIVMTLSIGYMATHLKRGWVPHDEGTLGQCAERVLNGQLPHRDFDDYTGGLTFLHALAFRELGISSASMRFVLFVFFVPWVSAVYYAASRFCSAYSAAAVTLLAMAWSVPNYPGPMPSWYNLFFATFGIAAILRHLEAGTRRWLFLAGLCGGLSVLAKITAAYFIAGALLFFVFREQTITSEQYRYLSRRTRLYTATVALGLAVFLAMLFSMIHKVAGTDGVVLFVLPACGLVGLLLAREFAGIAGQDRERFVVLMRMCIPFGVGIVIPVVVYMVPYFLSGSIHDLVYGVAGAPARAIRFAVLAPNHPATMVTIIPIIVPVMLAYECSRLGRAICGGALVLYACAVLVFSTRSSFIYGLGWLSLETAIPILVLASVAILWTSRAQQNLSIMRQQQIVLLMSVAALCSLMQFPFAAPVYFFYAAPLVILAAAALFASAAHPPRFVLGALLCFYLLFVILRVSPGLIYQLGAKYAPDIQTARLTIARAGGLRVQPDDALLYDELIPLVQSHAAGKFIYAAPDCPEVYFLSGLQNPTRHYFDFAEDPVGHTTRILHALESLNVNVVAIHKDPEFSGPMPPDLQEALEKRYPHSAELDRFQVRWKK